MADPSHHLQIIYSEVKEWLLGNYTGIVMRKMHDKAILRSLFDTPSPILMSVVMTSLPTITNLIEHRRRMPVMVWPWVDSSSDPGNEAVLWDNYADIISHVQGHVMYSYGNGSKFKHTTGSEDPVFFLCRDVDLPHAAPEGVVYRVYKDVNDNGITLMKANMTAKRSTQRVYVGNLENQDGYWEVPSDLSILCVLASSEEHKYQLFISAFISLAIVQAVSIARGASKAGCIKEIVALSSKPSMDTIGGQISVFAAVYNRLLRPAMHGTSDTPVGSDPIFIWEGLPPVDEMTVSVNMYWLRELGKEDNKQVKRAGRKVIGRGNALFFSETLRPLRWLLLSATIVTLSIVSVVYQDIHWGEKMEKFLNLLFTATVATVIGVAGIHPEGNWLYNVFRGTRRITSASDFEEGVFADVIQYLETCEGVGVRRRCRMTTTVGGRWN